MCSCSGRSSAIYTQNDFRQLVVAIEATPARLGGLGKIEDHGERRLVLRTLLLAHGPVADGRERTFEHVARSKRLPVFGSEQTSGGPDRWRCGLRRRPRSRQRAVGSVDDGVEMEGGDVGNRESGAAAGPDAISAGASTRAACRCRNHYDGLLCNVTPTPPGPPPSSRTCCVGRCRRSDRQGNGGQRRGRQCRASERSRNRSRA
jgi:hypothetical protein